MLLSLEQVESLAPDPGTLKRARSLARPKNFQGIGGNERALWAVALGSDHYETCIDLQGPAYRCSCPVPRPPCKHALGLLMLAATAPALVQDGEPPPSHAAWLHKRDAALQARESRAGGPVKDPKAQARRAAQRERHVTRGLEELQRFLEDCMRLGLADTARRTDDVWDQVQRRLIDAQARGLAGYLGWIREQIGNGGDWTGRVFYALARLHLMVSAYAQRERLDPALVEDLRDLIGWSRQREEILAQPPIEDDWLVLNRGLRYESGRYTQTVWLFAIQSRRFAQELSFATDFNRETLPSGYVPGTLIRAAAHFHSRYQPLRATLVRPRAFEYRSPEDLDALHAVAYPDLDRAIRALQERRARDPLGITWPLLIRDLRPVLKDHQLALADAAGRLLPLDRDFRQKWRFLALTGPEPTHVFLTHDGFHGRPWAIWRDARWFALNLDETDDA